MSGYSENPCTIGQHIRNKRINDKIYQSDLAQIIGVTESTVYNWEHGTEPEIRYMPQIINYLGYIPFDRPNDNDIISCLAWHKKIKGMSFEKLGKAMNRSHEQLEDWLSGRVYPSKKNIQMIKEYCTRQCIIEIRKECDEAPNY